MPITPLLEKLAEIERLLQEHDSANLGPNLARMCAAALKIVYHAPSGEISKMAGNVATSARLWSENPSKRDLYEKPLRSAVRSLRRALTDASAE